MSGGTVVNVWSNSVGQGVTFTSITSSLQSCVVGLNSTYNVGAGNGTATAGNWLFTSASWTQNPAIAEVHVGVGDDIRSWYREYPASQGSANTRTAIAYTPNLARVPTEMYVAPDGQTAALTVLVTEVSGLGPWDTVVSGAPDTNYAHGTSLTLSLGTPGAASFFIASAGGDSTAAGQALAPSGWTTLHTVSQSDGSDQLASNVLTSAYLSSSGSAQTIHASGTAATDLSGAMLAVYTTGIDPVPAGQNPNWPPMIFEAGFGSGFNTPDSEVVWTDISDRLWSWDETTGIEFNLGQLQSTDLDIELDNYDAALTPTNSNSPYYPDVLPGTPLRLRAALGTLGGVTVNRWYIIQRNAAQWGEAIDDALRRYCEVSGTDLWAALSDTPPSFYRSEVYADGPGWWWPCDDQPGTAGVLPTSLLNAAVGSTTVLSIEQSGGEAEYLYCTDGYQVSDVLSFPPPVPAIYTVGADPGWMFGDPQGSPASLGTGNPVTATQGSAAWQASQQYGENGSDGWYLYATDTFPSIATGITVEIWFNYPFYAGPTAFRDTHNDVHTPVAQQPITNLTILTLADSGNVVAQFYLDSTYGHLNVVTYNGATATTNTINPGCDLRSNSWHMLTFTLTQSQIAVWLDGGATAQDSFSVTVSYSAWNKIFANGYDDENGGNVSMAHLAVYPYVLPYYRILTHYWSAISGFGQLPAPTGVTVTWTPPLYPGSSVGTYFVADGSIPTDVVDPGGYSASNGVAVSAVVVATAPGGSGTVTSGPSAWSTGSGQHNDDVTGGMVENLFISWTGLAPNFNLYTADEVGSETEAATVNGSGDSFYGGYGSSADGAGVCQTGSGDGSSPPASPSAIGDTVGQRIERLMRAGRCTSPNRCIDPAPLLVQAPGTSGAGVQAGAAIQAIQQSDGGMLYVDNSNNLTYWQRPHLAAQYSNPVWILGPNTGAGQQPYYKMIRWLTDPQRVINAIGVTPLSPTGAALPVITPTNASAVDASQANYGAQPYSVTSWLQSSTEQQNQANSLFSNFGVPRRRAERVMIDAAPDPAAWIMILGANIGDVCTLQDWEVGGNGPAYTYRITELKRVLSRGTHDHQVTGHIELTLDWEPSYWS